MKPPASKCNIWLLTSTDIDVNASKDRHGVHAVGNPYKRPDLLEAYCTGRADATMNSLRSSTMCRCEGSLSSSKLDERSLCRLRR